MSQVGRRASSKRAGAQQSAGPCAGTHIRSRGDTRSSDRTGVGRPRRVLLVVLLFFLMDRVDDAKGNSFFETTA